MTRKVLPVLAVLAVLTLGLFLINSYRAPHTVEDFYGRGKKYYDQKKYAEAIIEFQNALQQDNRHRDASYFLAQSYLAEKDMNSAAKQLAALLEYHPGDVPASIQLGNIFLMGSRQDPRYPREARDLAE